MKWPNETKNVACHARGVRRAMDRYLTMEILMIRLLPLLIILSFSSSLIGQTFYGSILGTVTDASGAVVPDAKVTATNLKTNEASVIDSDSEGKFSIVNLVPATYKVEVTKEGFKRFLGESLTVDVGAIVRVDAALDVGSADQTVQVTSQASLLPTDSSTISQVIGGAQVQGTPLNGRNVMKLISLAPGVVPQGSTQGDLAGNQHGHTSPGGWGNYQLGGAIAGESAVYIDGSPVNVLGQNAIGLVVTQDAIQEFTVATSNASADFGRFGGGVVSMTTKSGGNDFHGSVYEYFRNTVLNANNFFNKQDDIPRPEWDQNQYGAVVNGPIKKDKAFFLFTWEGFRSAIGTPSPTNVPTTAMQNGIFTDAIHDPLGNCNIVHDAAAGTWTITNLYVGNCGDPTAKVMKTYYPPPNSSGSANYTSSPVVTDAQNQYNGRVDYTLSNKQRIFGRYTYWTLADTGTNQFDNYDGWPTAQGHVLNTSQQAVVGDTYAFNPTTVLDVRLNYMRQYYPQLPESTSVNQAQFGPAYAALAPQTIIHTLPVYQLSGSHNLYNFSSVSSYSVSWFNTYGIGANMIKSIGSHTLKFGTELRLMDQSGTGFASYPSGEFNFSNAFTGDEFADFLLGYPDSGSLNTYNSTASYNYYQAYYVTDTWRVMQNLTLNLGLRYELPGAIAERNNKDTVLLPNAVDPYTGITGTEALVESGLYPHRPTVLPKDDLFAPRLGFAYSPDSKTVIRGGYGLSYLPPDIQSGVFASASLVNGATTTFTNGGKTPTTLLYNPFPGGIIQPTGRSDPSFMTKYVGQQPTGPVPFQSYPYVQEWNLTVSRDFGRSWVAQIGYSGLTGTHIPGIGASGITGRDLNELSSQYYSLGNALLGSVSPGSSETLGQSLRPYPQYQNVYDTANFTGFTNYNSLQANVNKRFGSGGTLLANYTWAREMGNTDTINGPLEVKSSISARGGGYGQIQDFNNPRGEYSLLSYNVAQRGVISYVLDLPFGRGQRFASNVAGAVSALVSGWNVSGITIFQSGFPLYITEANSNNLVRSFGGGTLRPNVVSGCNKSIGGTATKRLNGWFNTACFTFPGQFAFGNESRTDGTLTSDGIANYDFALMKTTKILERADVQFRTEFFNIFNRPQFAPPVAQHDSSTFGDVIAQANQPRQIQFSLRVNF